MNHDLFQNLQLIFENLSKKKQKTRHNQTTTIQQQWQTATTTNWHDMAMNWNDDANDNGVLNFLRVQIIVAVLYKLNRLGIVHFKVT